MLSEMSSPAIYDALLDWVAKNPSMSINDLFQSEPNRAEEMSAQVDELYLDYSKNTLSKQTLKALFALCESKQLKQAIEDLVTGRPVNVTEQRPAWHTALRAALFDKNQSQEHQEIVDAFNQMKGLVDKIETGQILNDSRVKDIVHLGIGGSDLGPRLLDEALKPFHASKINVHFVSNIDPLELTQVLENCSPKTTLFILASKSFSTQETLENGKLAKQWLSADIKDPSKHFLAITANSEKAQQWGIQPTHILKIWDWVGGRFSVWSSISLPVAVKIGFDAFKSFLEGGWLMDKHFSTAPIERNIPVILALVGYWHHTILNYPSHAVLPYACGLQKLPDYLQQLEMESNGKAVQINRKPVSSTTCPILWGQAGTNGQHAFYQLLHQGTQHVSTDFILVAQGKTSHKQQHQLLLSHGIAQAKILMDGLKSEDPFKAMPGNKPSTSILLKRLSPKTLGMLIAMYEHKVFVQGVLWGINSFDQPGVELGKRLAGDINQQMNSGDIEPSCSSTKTMIEKIFEFQS